MYNIKNDTESPSGDMVPHQEPSPLKGAREAGVPCPTSVKKGTIKNKKY